MNRSWKKDSEWQKEVHYFDVICWGKLADNCMGFLKKGRGVRVAGRLQQDRWEKDGEKRTRVLIVADHVEFKPEKKQENSTEQKDDFVDDIPF